MEPLLEPFREGLLEPLLDPSPLRSDEWALIARLLYNLFFFTGVGLAGMCALLLGHGIIPSPPIVPGPPAAPRPVVLVRWLLYPLAAVSLGLAVWFLWRVMVLSRLVLLQYYPRFLN